MLNAGKWKIRNYGLDFKLQSVQLTNRAGLLAASAVHAPQVASAAPANGTYSAIAAYFRKAPPTIVSNVKFIEDAVRSLPPKEFAEFRSWFAEFDEVAWDVQFEGDLVDGKLGSLLGKV